MTYQTSPRIAFAAIAVSSAISAAHAQKADPTALQEHIAFATAAAKSDLQGALGLCKTASPTPGPSFMDMYRAMQKEPPLAQVMDELYFLGAQWTTAWAIKSSAGLIIVDAMDNSDEAVDYIEGGLRKLGLDPADIKYVVVSHAHGDHYGGAVYLKDKFGPHIVMSEIDWKALEVTQRDPLFGSKRNPMFGEPPKRGGQRRRYAHPRRHHAQILRDPRPYARHARHRVHAARSRRSTSRGGLGRHRL
jgi:metallo-beta-lactamase class B